MMNRRVVGPMLSLLACLGLLAFVGACQKQVPQTAEVKNAAEAANPDSVARHERGQQAYMAYCAQCHGPWGEGDGPRSADVEKQAGARPAMLNSTPRLTELGRAELINVITQGGGRTHRSNVMPRWGEKLKSGVIEEIADYVLTLPSIKSGIPRATIEKYLASTPGTVDSGRKLFVYYCTICHGPYGEGDGFMADSMWARSKVRPRNLTDSLYFVNKTDKEMFVTVSLGGGYTGHSRFMPGWSVTFKPQEIRDLVSYVRSISRTKAQP